jgi:hypothetical protein
MNKTLLLHIALWITWASFSQNTPNINNSLCDSNNDGAEMFDMNAISNEILGNLSPNDYNISHHLSQSDAVNNLNPLPASYTNITNPQLIFANLINTTTNQSTIIAYNLIVNSPPIAPVVTTTSCLNSTNSVCFDLTSVVPTITQGNTNFDIVFYENYNPQSTVNVPITNLNCYTAAPISGTTNSFLPVQYTIEDLITGCITTSGLVELIGVQCNPCPAVSNISVSNITETSADYSWVENGNATEWQIEISINGIVSQIFTATTNPYTIYGLTCGQTVQIGITPFCSATQTTNMVYTTFTTLSCNPSGQPQDLSMCTSTSQYCFDLTQNDANILANLDPNEHTITYHPTQSDADNNTNSLTASYCVTNGTTTVIYSRISNNVNGNYYTNSFNVSVSNINPTVQQLIPMEQCDTDGNGNIDFDLTTVAAQISSTNSIAFYTSLADAQTEQNAIISPTIYNVTVQSNAVIIFIRESVTNDCDNIYTVNLSTFPNCNLASVCSLSNSLCGALGNAFPNTIGIPSTGSLGCLTTTPNPTWFYLPISSSGTINLMIQQSTDPNIGTNNIDVDYVLLGPFTDPVSPCVNQITPNYIVNCSYSSSAVEYPTITNAQAGEYYLIMVTNYSNQSGYIKISELGNSQGTIECSGIRLNAFLDTNNNGSQDAGENNFPLGQFHYEMNNNGIVHNIVAPTGIYNIYDSNSSNSYDIGFDIDPSYASMYNIITPSYSNVSIIANNGVIVYNFPITTTQVYSDVAVTIIPINAPRPGFTYTNKVVYSNLGNQTVSGTLLFNNDPNVSITSIGQAGTTPTANGFSYSYSNLTPFETRSFDVIMQIPPVPTVNAGQNLTNTASITPLAGDINQQNNTFSLTQIVVNAYDPNDKMEAHGEEILHSSFTSEDYLFYTIRFENTGNASAINIKINDVLDIKLDETSIKMVDASHEYTLDRVNNNLTWTMDNIMLPVSVQNTPIGKGYISFKIKPKSGYAVGDIIPNTASIYFDYNPPIITNTFNTEFVAALSSDAFENKIFNIYPNPAKNVITVSSNNTNESIQSIAIYDVLGKTVLNRKGLNVSQEILYLDELLTGVYTIEIISNSKNISRKKLIIE